MDTLLGAAIVTVVVILVVVGVVRVATRQRPKGDHFGAGGQTRTVPPGTRGVVKTEVGTSDVDASGVVSALGEDWSARSRTGGMIPAGAPVTVLGQDGLTLIVEPDSTATRTQG
jgi:membrane protein implicated in regulation of membrane protease activity